MANITSSNTNTALVLSTDTVLLHPTVGRALITLGTMHEQTGAAETLEIFLSSDASSAAGERIDKMTFAADETMSPLSINGAGVPNGYYLIAKATNGSRVMATITYTQYSGDA